MSQAQKADISAFNEIIFELNELVRADIDEVAYRRKLNEIEVRAEDLKKLSLAYGYSALGSIAAARMDIASMQKFHRVSIQHCNDFDLRTNYAISMGKCGLLDESLALAISLFHENRTDKSMAHLLGTIYFHFGNEAEFLKYAEIYRKLAKEDHGLWAAYLTEIQEIGEITSACAAMTARTMAALEA